MRSLQALRLAPGLVRSLPGCDLRNIITTWDYSYTVESIGASAFDRVYRAAKRALALRLGGAWWLSALERSELSVWWCRGIDALLNDPVALGGEWHAAFLRELDADHSPLEAWGTQHTMTMPHMVLAGVPGTGRGPYPLPGCVATVRQGNNVPAGDGVQTVGPAYRFVTDLGEDAAYTSIAGGIDGSVFSKTYVHWLDDWLVGRYHRLVPP